MNVITRAEILFDIIRINFHDKNWCISYLAKELEITALKGYNSRFEIPESSLPDFNKILDF